MNVRYGSRLVCLLAMTAVAGPGTSSAAAQAGGSITVDTTTRYQTMQGFGSTERVFDDPHVFDNFNPTTARSLTTLSSG